MSIFDKYANCDDVLSTLDKIKDESFKLDPAVKETWVKALRSGDYKQTDGVLEYKGCHCCLGVLATVQGEKLDDRNGNYTIDGDEYAMMLPNGYKGMSEHLMGQFASLNDSEGLTFDEIADVIEELL